MASPTFIGSTNAVNAILKLIATQALEYVTAELVMGSLVNRNFEPDFAKTGDTINVPIAPKMSVNNIAEGGKITNQAASLGNAQVVLTTHAEASFLVSDISKVLVQPDLSKLTMDSAVKAMAESIEADILKTYSLFTDNTAVGGVRGLMESDLDDAETTLYKARVPGSETKYLVVTADTYSDLRQIPRFSENQTIGNPIAQSALVNGAVGRLKNFNIFRHLFVPKVAGTAYNLAFSRDAIALVTRRLPAIPPGMGVVSEYAEMGNFGMRVLMSYNHDYLCTQFTIDCLYGVSALRNNYAVQVLSNT